MSSSIDTYNQSGEKSGTVKLSPEVFAVKAKIDVLHQAAVANRANLRRTTAHTKHRGEVSGGGKKPWQQKGTGRARAGSSRSPIWRGGGVAFGPQGNENHILKLSTTSKHVAVKQALSVANKDGLITVIDSFDCNLGKVKETMALLSKNKINEKDRVLLVVDNKDEMTLRATNNVKQVKVVKPTYLNVFDILNSDKIIITKKSVPMISEWLVGKEEA